MATVHLTAGLEKLLTIEIVHKIAHLRVSLDTTSPCLSNLA